VSSTLDIALNTLRYQEHIELAKFDVREACTPRSPGSTGQVHEKQLRAVLDPARFIVACLPRRSGKTMSEAIRAVSLCLSKPNKVVWYLSFTISYGIDTFTDGCLRGLLKRFDISATVAEGGSYIEFPNGSSISIRGIDDVHSIEKLRGRNPPDLVFLDECQSMREQLLAPMVNNIIRPALLDREGTLIVTGTPSPVPAGFFYNIWTNPKAWSRHEWTLYDNPTKSRTYYDAFLAKERADRGITEADPSYRREWLGEWAIEEDLRVFKYGALNHVPGDYNEFATPSGLRGRRTLTRHHLRSSGNRHMWRSAVGIDIGSGDRTAVVVLGQHMHDSHVVQLYEWVIERKQEPVTSDLVDQLRWVRNEFEPSHWFFDSGGAGGKMLMETLRRDHGFPLMEAARKTDRRGQIEFVNMWLRRGQLLIPSNSASAEDCLKTLWDQDKLKIGVWEYSRTWHPDPMDALRYCAFGIYPTWYKKAAHYTDKEWDVEAEAQAVEKEMTAPARGGLVDGDVTTTLDSFDDQINATIDDRAFGAGGKSYTGW
jgi:hypothetical protein